MDAMQRALEKYDNYRVTRIGAVNMGVYGNDEYMLVCDLNDDIDVTDVEEAFNHHVCKDTDEPGGYFCLGVTTVHLPSDNECVVIIHHRFNP